MRGFAEAAKDLLFVLCQGVVAAVVVEKGRCGMCFQRAHGTAKRHCVCRMYQKVKDLV